MVLGIGLALAFNFFDAEPEDDGSGGDGEGDALPEPEGDVVPVDQIVTIDSTTTELETGAGNDVVSVDPTLANLDSLLVNTGAGNDVVDVTFDVPNAAVTGSTFELGDGDDTFEGDLVVWDSVINGGAGDDRIEVGSMLSTGEVNGGAGDDEITGSFGEFHGDEGNDTVTLTASNVEATGQWGTAYGDAGNDTLRYTGNLSEIGTVFDLGGAPALHGGEGTDAFEIDLQVGEASTDPAVPPTHEFESVVLADFEAGVETLQVDTSDYADAGYVFSDARLETDTDGETRLFMTFDHDSEEAQEVQLSFGLAAASWSDITFTGASPAAFFPAA